MGFDHTENSAAARGSSPAKSKRGASPSRDSQRYTAGATEMDESMNL
jgi:hypothetical protein